MRALMVINPTASSVTPSRLRVVERALEAAFDLDIATTTHRGHAIELAREAALMGAKAVIAFGGDGTVNEIANGLVGASATTDVTLGVLPGGGTNVLARALGSPRDIVDATGHLLELAESNATRRIGIGRLRAQVPGGEMTRVFTQNCGLGLDAETVRIVESTGWRPRLGDLAFVLASFRGLAAVRRAGSPQLRVRCGTVDADVWWVTSACGDPVTYWGGRELRVLPEASHDRGLDVLAARSAGMLRTMRWAAQALTTARHVDHRRLIHLEDLARCEITARSPVALQADGEWLGEIGSVVLESLPAALPVYAA